MKDEWVSSRKQRHQFTVSWQEGQNDGKFQLRRELAKGEDVTDLIKNAAALGVVADVYVGHSLSPLSPRNCRLLSIRGPFTPSVMALTAITLAAAMQQPAKRKVKKGKKGGGRT